MPNPGDIVALRKKITFTKETDDGITPVVIAAEALSDEDFDLITAQVIIDRQTKEGLIEATVIIIGRTAAAGNQGNNGNNGNN